MPIIPEEHAERILRNTLSERDMVDAVHFTDWLTDRSKSYLRDHSPLNVPDCEFELRVDILFNQENIQQYITSLGAISSEEEKLLKQLKAIDPKTFEIFEEGLRRYKTESAARPSSKHDTMKEFLEVLKGGRRKLSENSVWDDERKILSQSRHLDTMLNGFFGLKGIYIGEGQSYNFRAEDDAVVHFNRVGGDVSITNPFDKLFLDALVGSSKSGKRYKVEGELHESVGLLDNDGRYFSRGEYSHVLETRKSPAYVLVGISSRVPNTLSEKDYKKNILNFLDRRPDYTIQQIAWNIDPNRDPSAVIRPLMKLVKENRLEFEIKEGIIYFKKIG